MLYFYIVALALGVLLAIFLGIWMKRDWDLEDEEAEFGQKVEDNLRQKYVEGLFALPISRPRKVEEVKEEEEEKAAAVISARREEGVELRRLDVEETSMSRRRKVAEFEDRFQKLSPREQQELLAKRRQESVKSEWTSVPSELDEESEYYPETRLERILKKVYDKDLTSTVATTEETSMSVSEAE